MKNVCVCVFSTAFPAAALVFFPPAGSNPSLEAKLGGGYSWSPSSHPSFFPGRQAVVTARGRQVGIFGVVHPEVLGAFALEYPVCALELNIEPFVFDSDLQQLLEGAGTEGSIHGWNLVH